MGWFESAPKKVGYEMSDFINPLYNLWKSCEKTMSQTVLPVAKNSLNDLQTFTVSTLSDYRQRFDKASYAFQNGKNINWMELSTPLILGTSILILGLYCCRPKRKNPTVRLERLVIDNNVYALYKNKETESSAKLKTASTTTTASSSIETYQTKRKENYTNEYASASTRLGINYSVEIEGIFCTKHDDGKKYDENMSASHFSRELQKQYENWTQLIDKDIKDISKQITVWCTQLDSSYFRKDFVEVDLSITINDKIYLITINKDYKKKDVKNANNSFVCNNGELVEPDAIHFDENVTVAEYRLPKKHSTYVVMLNHDVYQQKDGNKIAKLILKDEKNEEELVETSKHVLSDSSNNLPLVDSIAFVHKIPKFSDYDADVQKVFGKASMKKLTVSKEIFHRLISFEQTIGGKKEVVKVLGVFEPKDSESVEETQKFNEAFKNHIKRLVKNSVVNEQIDFNLFNNKMSDVFDSQSKYLRPLIVMYFNNRLYTFKEAQRINHLSDSIALLKNKIDYGEGIFHRNFYIQNIELMEKDKLYLYLNTHEACLTNGELRKFDAEMDISAFVHEKISTLGKDGLMMVCELQFNERMEEKSKNRNLDFSSTEYPTLTEKIVQDCIMQ